MDPKEDGLLTRAHTGWLYNGLTDRLGTIARQPGARRCTLNVLLWVDAAGKRDFMPIFFPVVAKRNWLSQSCGEGRQLKEAATPRPVGRSSGWEIAATQRALETPRTQERVANDPADGEIR
jgi:hypothetical protein